MTTKDKLWLHIIVISIITSLLALCGTSLITNAIGRRDLAQTIVTCCLAIGFAVLLALCATAIGKAYKKSIAKEYKKSIMKYSFLIGGLGAFTILCIAFSIYLGVSFHYYIYNLPWLYFILWFVCLGLGSSAISVVVNKTAEMLNLITEDYECSKYNKRINFNGTLTAIVGVVVTASFAIIIGMMNLCVTIDMTILLIILAYSMPLLLVILAGLSINHSRLVYLKQKDVVSKFDLEDQQ